MGVKVRERPKNSGIWWVYIDHEGKRKAKKIGKTKSLANEIAKKIEARLILKDTGIFDESSRVSTPTLNEIANQWLEIQVKPSKRITTYNRYKGLLCMYVAPQIGSIKITELKRMYVLKVLRHMLKKNLSRSSIEQAKNVISGIAEFAIDHEELNVNPTHGVMKRLGLKRKSNSNQIAIFTKEEITLLLETCRTYRPDFYFLFLTAFRTGLRLGEILALKWENVNWKKNYIVVDSSWRNGHLTSTKTGKNRNVDLSNQLVVELFKLLKKRKEEALRSGTNEIVPIIFHTHQEYTS